MHIADNLIVLRLVKLDNDNVWNDKVDSEACGLFSTITAGIKTRKKCEISLW